MNTIIKGHENYLITHKMFIWVMRQKHKVCDLTETQFCKRETDFWTKKLHTCSICAYISSVSKQKS